MLANDERLNALTAAILGSAIEGHRVLGPGLLESIYLASIRLGAMHRIDLLIEDSVVIEVKAVDALLPVHQAQVLTYLRLAGCPAGLLVNFNVPRLTDGVRRLLNPKREGAEKTEKAGSHGGTEQRRHNP